MRTVVAAAFITVAATSTLPVGAADEHAGHGAMHAANPAASSLADGLIKKVDKSAGKVTIAHGRLENLGMSPMTMVFSVKDKAWLDQMKEGDKIRFRAESLNGAFTVTQFEKTN